MSIVYEATGTRTRFQAAEHENQVREKTRGSWERYQRARRTLAGGVSSGLRRNARPYPLYFERGSVSKIFDVDGNGYLDYTLAWGPLILGHSHPLVVEAVQRQAAEMRLQSTVMGAKPKAVIDGALVGEGDVVAQFRVLKIEARRITVEREGIKLEIQMK